MMPTTRYFDDMTEKALARDDLTVDQKINTVINMELCTDRDKDAGNMKAALSRAGFRIVPMTGDQGKIEIPDHHQEFCKALARVAREYGVDNFSASYRPGWKDPWRETINLSWEQGRHGAAADKIHIHSDMRINTKIDPVPPS
jgi:hypothetical protein